MEFCDIFDLYGFVYKPSDFSDCIQRGKIIVSVQHNGCSFAYRSCQIGAFYNCVYTKVSENATVLTTLISREFSNFLGMDQQNYSPRVGSTKRSWLITWFRPSFIVSTTI